MAANLVFMQFSLSENSGVASSFYLGGGLLRMTKSSGGSAGHGLPASASVLFRQRGWLAACRRAAASVGLGVERLGKAALPVATDLGRRHQERVAARSGLADTNDQDLVRAGRAVAGRVQSLRQRQLPPVAAGIGGH